MLPLQSNPYQTSFPHHLFQLSAASLIISAVSAIFHRSCRSPSLSGDTGGSADASEYPRERLE
jgi:hypothetical protein